jgi:lipopolysaccharide/colanic/teichoic acid biosynthesis glycosyltransferase/glycosyltransferase involved in cell wall biosynthesis
VSGTTVGEPEVAYDRVKRIIDVVLTVVGLLLLWPVFVVIAWRVHREFGRPIVFRQQRPGLHGRLFTLRKFRTMTDERGPDGELLPDAQRLTRFGRFLRSSSLDELPEMLNVLKGEMSLVGPRPLLVEYLELYTPEQARRHEVRPGITGWAQINGRNDMPWREKLALDVWYVDHRSVWLDVRILLTTLWVMVTRRGVSLAGHATTARFQGTGDAASEGEATPGGADGPGEGPAVVRGRTGVRQRPVLVHLTTVDMSLALLLLPQLVAFREAGYEVIGVSAPGPYVETLRAHGIEHVALSRSTRSNDVRADLATAREFVALCRRLRPEIVHTHNPKPGIYGRIGARLAGVPVVVNTVHGLYAQPEDPLPRRAVVYGLERIAAAFSDAELVQNPEDLEVLRRLRVPAERLHLLGNGIDLDRFDPAKHAGCRSEVRAELGIRDDEVVVGLVGRLVIEKGYREVFAAARALRDDHPHVRFVVVGPAEPEKADAISQAELDRAAETGVMFLGLRDDVERLYPAMDLYVLASHREGFPRSAMEAAAMGLPLVVTDIRGCRQVVEHGANGLSFPVRDMPALVQAILALVDDVGQRTVMSQASRVKAEAEFDVRRQIARTLDGYGTLLNASTAAPHAFPGGLSASSSSRCWRCE